MKNFLIFFTIISLGLISSKAYSEENNTLPVLKKIEPNQIELKEQSAVKSLEKTEEKIEFKSLLMEIPSTSLIALDSSFSKSSIPWWVGIIGSTLVLYNNDEVILENFQREGRAAHIGNADNTKAVLSVGDIDIIRLPTDTGSGMYFLGDGWMHAGISLGFILNGQINNNTRAYNTGMRIVHGMVTSTIFSQLLKRAFGRESPYVKSEPFGKWSPFPSMAEYQEKTSRYDAMPSGHIMTATMTFTIINDSYPEYSNVVFPLEVLWLTALGAQMVNNGVHWASDYPLGIAMGYVFGKASMHLGQKNKSSNETSKSETSWMVLPYTSASADGLTWMFRY